ncbi:MAG: DsbE family thiol:disulfide interchange protein [Cocleimonas sp.]|nr:DsbE family thiol:disulfide interchange protein [Cocleimonas sp.]
MKKTYLLPLIIFSVLALLLYKGLYLDSRNVPSPFIGKPAPAFDLPRLYQKDQRISAEKMKGQVWLLNVFASWCVSCRAEHTVLTGFIRQYKVPAVGLNYKDYGTEDYGHDVISWLGQLGNPYTYVAVDTEGRTGINWGVYGVPESFVIDKKGIIRYKFTGPVSQKAVVEILVPLITTLRKEPA